MEKQNKSFENNMQRLEQIVRAMERGDVALEESLKLFEEGTALAAACTKQLDEAELKVSEILPEDVPVGDSTEDRRRRQEIIKQFYFYCKKENPNLCRFNNDLGENIYSFGFPQLQHADWFLFFCI